MKEWSILSAFGPIDLTTCWLLRHWNKGTVRFNGLNLKPQMKMLGVKFILSTPSVFKTVSKVSSHPTPETYNTPTSEGQ